MTKFKLGGIYHCEKIHDVCAHCTKQEWTERNMTHAMQCASSKQDANLPGAVHNAVQAVGNGEDSTV